MTQMNNDNMEGLEVLSIDEDKTQLTIQIEKGAKEFLKEKIHVKISREKY